MGFSPKKIEQKMVIYWMETSKSSKSWNGRGSAGEYIITISRYISTLIACTGEI
jgi:hypothetical protein